MIFKQEIYHSVVALSFAIQEAVLCGWKLDGEDAVNQVGFHYELKLTRNEEEPVKMTTQERLAKAREAKALKRKQEGA